MKKVISDLTLTPEQKAELEALATMQDNQVNTRDLPEQIDWTGARRGVFFRPIKKQLTLRLDSDLIDWFQRQAPNGKGYQTSINEALREYVLQHSDKG
jgi:uncharacterized protein (DUF4415 family)